MSANTLSIAGRTSHNYYSQRLRLNYVDWGNPSAPPMILIHGGRDHCRNWDWVAEQFREEYHIIAPDLRGHGDSQWMEGGTYGQLDYVYDIAQLLHQKDMIPVTIIGHSLGGAIALQVPGGGGPVSVFVRAAAADVSTPFGFALSNAVQVDFQP